MKVLDGPQALTWEFEGKIAKDRSCCKETERGKIKIDTAVRGE